MLAAHGGYTETVKALIEAGADVDLRDRVSPGNLYCVCILPYFRVIKCMRLYPHSRKKTCGLNNDVRLIS